MLAFRQALASSVFVKFFSQLFRRRVAKVSADVDLANLSHRDAIEVYRARLETDPYNVQVLNNLGACYINIGNEPEARRVFELAYALDDTFAPGVVNHAKMLIDQRNTAEALPLLEHVKTGNPDLAYVDVIYSGVCFNRGDITKARKFQLQGWLAYFDNLRLANGYLFAGAHGGIDEAQSAAEHRFWAETLAPLPFDAIQTVSSLGEISSARLPGDKIRIGYWSPDFRSHSVRYFFRPLLENHDQSKFEIFLYHDTHHRDEQTECIAAAASHFHDVYGLTDQEMVEFIRTHRLDILVEMAGHSSYNRINLLQLRLATIQISAIGYPPTSGLSSMDGKVLDRFTVTPECGKYYTESALVLPSSFWCFDPKEDVPVAPEPPVRRNGYITFACVGNISKITDDVLISWKSILDCVPNSRLLIRSISMTDQALMNEMRSRLVASGIDVNRVDLCKPEGGKAYFESYNAIDIVLDTFPFNGGTTTCFATYMGVPVVSMVGESLISRMGFSVLSNLGVGHLAVFSTTDYIASAVSLSQDLAFLSDFRRDVRARYDKSALGNGKLFAKEFEETCLSLLSQQRNSPRSYKSDVAILPANEIIRRAYAVLQRGQTSAMQRIVDHCLRHYPDSGAAHLLVAQHVANTQGVQEAVDYLLSRLQRFPVAEQGAAWINITRWHLLLGCKDEAVKAVNMLDQLQIDDEFDRLQTRLYRLCTKELLEVETISPPVNAEMRRFRVVIPSDNAEAFNQMCRQITNVCLLPPEWCVFYERCKHEDRIEVIENALQREDADILVVLQQHIEIINPNLLIEISNGLAHCDVLGFYGASRWQRLDWRLDAFGHKAAGFIADSTESKEVLEIQMLGTGTHPLCENMVVLSGGFMAINASKGRSIQFDAALNTIDSLIEEDWTHSAFKAGLRLAVHRNLGIRMHPTLDNTDMSKYRQDARLGLAKKMGFEPFTEINDDQMMLSTPIASLQEAMRITTAYFDGSE